MDFNNEGFQITAVMHPHTYLNKILLGSKQGTLQLWNIKQDKMLYVFEGWNSAITCLEQVYYYLEQVYYYSEKLSRNKHRSPDLTNKEYQQQYL